MLAGVATYPQDLFGVVSASTPLTLQVRLPCNSGGAQEDDGGGDGTDGADEEGPGPGTSGGAERHRHPFQKVRNPLAWQCSLSDCNDISLFSFEQLL